MHPAIIYFSLGSILAFCAFVVFSNRVDDSLVDRFCCSVLAMLSMSGLMTQYGGHTPIKAISFILLMVGVIMFKQLVMSAFGYRLISRYVLLIRMRRSSHLAQKVTK